MMFQMLDLNPYSSLLKTDILDYGELGFYDNFAKILTLNGIFLTG